MKKIISLGICCIVSSAHAVPELYFNGFMLQAAFGGTAAQYNLTQNLSMNLPGVEVNHEPNHANLFANSPVGVLSAGYSYQMPNNFVIAGAFTVGYADAKSTEHTNYTNMLIGDDSLHLDNQIITEFTYDFALLFKPGYAWTGTTVFYGLIGPRWGHFESEVKTNLSYPLGIHDYTASASNTVDSYKLGLTFGLGIQQLLTPRYSWALEYAYTLYGSIDTASVSTVIDDHGVPIATSSITDSPSIKAYTNTLLFYIAYRI